MTGQMWGTENVTERRQEGKGKMMEKHRNKKNRMERTRQDHREKT